VIAVPRDGFKWFGMAAAIVVGCFLISYVMVAPKFGLVLAAFYGALLTSYLSRVNVVWLAALGALAGVALIIFMAMVNDWPAIKLQLGAVLRYDSDHERTHPSTIRLIFGFVFALLAVLPISLTGSSVGEHLSLRRRSRP